MDVTASKSPSTTPAAEPATPDAPNPKAAFAERRARMAEVSKGVLGGGKKPAAAPSAAQAAPTPAATAAVAAIEASGATAPTQKPGESDQSYELRLAKALRQNTALEAENVSTKRKLQQIEAEFGSVKSLIEAVKKDPARVADLLEMAGTSPDQVAQLMIDGKIKREARATLPPEVQERMAKLEAAAKKLEEKEAREAEEAAKRERETQEAEQRKAHLSVVTGTLEALKAELPLTSLLPGAADKLLNEVYAEMGRRPGENVDVAAVCRGAEKVLIAEGRALLSTPAAVKAIVGDDPKIRDTFIAALGLTPAREQSPKPSPASESRAANEDGPRSLTHAAASEVPARVDRVLTKSERRERLRQAGKAVLSGA